MFLHVSVFKKKSAGNWAIFLILRIISWSIFNWREKNVEGPTEPIANLGRGETQTTWNLIQFKAYCSNGQRTS